MATVGLRDVRKRYAQTDVIHGITMDIADGEFIVIVGPSGCGKSTLLRMVAGLEAITEGQVSIDDEVVNKLEPMDRNIAMVFQNYALYPHMSVFNNMAYGLKNRRMPKAEIEQKVREAADILELGALLERKPSQLSGGQRQRVAMGRAIVRNPKVFLFDEPLSNLDAKLRVNMRLEIKKLQRRLGITTIYVTHDQVEAMTMADRLVVMNSGIAEQIGTPREVYKFPGTKFVAGFIGSPAMNFAPASLTPDKSALRAFGTEIPLPQGVAPERLGSVEVGIRPEHLHITTNPRASRNYDRSRRKPWQRYDRLRTNQRVGQRDSRCPHRRGPGLRSRKEGPGRFRSGCSAPIRLRNRSPNLMRKRMPVADGGACSEVPMYDIVVIGGGINGCGIARDAAGRGYKVLLAERGDLAQGTSSGSTKLIHGGLRYLEHFEFRLVRESLEEREILWAMAPHIIWPMRFVLPHAKGLRPAWLLRLGLFLYDHIGGRRQLPPTKVLNLVSDPAGAPLKRRYSSAFEYSDCWVDDARLVVLNARDAADRGATIKTRTSVTRIARHGHGWRIDLKDARTGSQHEVSSRVVVNAAGPWVDTVLNSVAGQNTKRNVRHVQGSHIVVPKMFDHDRSYIFQNADNRIFFAIPYEQDFTLIGTTDQDYQGSLDAVVISRDEINYLCTATNDYFRERIGPEDIVWSYSAVRPLFDDGSEKAQEATRDYTLRTDGNAGEAKLINIFGGKITTYRRLAIEVLDVINDELACHAPAWTATESLPGGDFEIDAFDTQLAQVEARYGFLDAATAYRMLRCYGTITHRILDGATTKEDLGIAFGSGLTQREVDYLRTSEWAETTDDILWRRTKLGLKLTTGQQQKLAEWLAANPVVVSSNAA